jgi:hypothetical protein
MSQENVEIVSKVIAAFNDHDADLVASYVGPDTEADWSASLAPYRGVYRGPDEWREWLRSRWEVWGDARWEPLEWVILGEARVLTVIRLLATGRGSGVDVTATAGVIWTVHGGKIGRATLFQSKDEALEAAGLSE